LAFGGIERRRALLCSAIKMARLHCLLPLVAAGAMMIARPAVGQLAGGQGEEAPRPRRQPSVLVLAIDDFTLPYVRLTFDALASGLMASAQRPALYLESLDGSRFSEPGYLDHAGAWLAQKYRTTEIDLVVPLGTDAFRFLVERQGEPFRAARVLYLEAGSVGMSMPTSGGLELQDHMGAAVQTIRQVLPGLTHLALVIGESPVERRRWTNFIRRTRDAGLEPIELTGLSMAAVQQAVARLPPHTAVIMLAPTTGPEGEVMPQGQWCAAISAAANAPAFTPAAHDFGCGVVGGLMRDWTLAGELLSREVAARLATPSTEVRQVPFSQYTRLAFDDRQLRRWGIPESRLPAGSEVRFREPSLWHDNRGAILGVIGVTALQTLLIGGLLFEHRRRRRAEYESRQNLAAIAHLDRRAAMGELATSLAHEISQPLHGILQNVDVADMVLDRSPGAPAGDELREIIGDIRKADVRATEMIKRMRAMLVKHELEARPVNLNDVARESVAIVRPDAAARGVQLEARLADGLPAVRGDAVHLQQVVLNLLINAVDAVTRMPPARRSVVVTTADNGAEVRVSVADTGFGIAAERIGDIFEPFYTTKGGGQGMGMGLAIARGIVNAHAGRIGALNNPQGGATVWFSVPTSPEVPS
jgi:signal transduction histidine kinase